MDNELELIKSQETKVTDNSCKLSCKNINDNDEPDNNEPGNNFTTDSAKKVDIPPPIAEMDEACEESFSKESCKSDNFKVDRNEILQFLLSGRSSYELIDSEEEALESLK